ncbi:hypothetical protein SSS_03992 [Sarcoptes scabiei]|uniref:PDZ domain-containing protein n=1 Tax=Sarcoptes scabiei TaxID=52283 RepID=A0A834VCK3_SARSC|nr:hypothetical protein SSS_03992 [Sarcoptes scabiei]
MITSNRNIVNINPITFRGVIGDRSNPNAIIPSNLFEQRDVQRAGWLRYIPFAEKYSQSNEYRFWVVFAVYGSKTPYLEFYKQRHRNLNQIDSNQTLSDGPVSKHSLFNCRHIASVIESNQQRHNEFSITLETHVIRLAADSHEVMLDWINSLKTKLISMKILQPSENLYSDCPPASSSTTSNPTIYRQSTGINSINQFEPRILRPTSTANNATSEELYEPIFEISNAVQSLSLNRAQSIPQDEGPPPYECIFNGSNNLEEIARFSFRESQVDKFKKEMEQINGISLKIRKKDCHNAIAFVDVHTFGIFVAGWKQKDHPYLHNSLHIGDQLVSINGMKIESASQIKRFVKQCSSNLDIIIRRVPTDKYFVSNVPLMAKI